MAAYGDCERPAARWRSGNRLSTPWDVATSAGNSTRQKTHIYIIHIHIIFSLSITCKKAKRYPTVKCWESYLFPTIMIGKNKFLFNWLNNLSWEPPKLCLSNFHMAQVSACDDLSNIEVPMRMLSSPKTIPVQQLQISRQMWLPLSSEELDRNFPGGIEIAPNLLIKTLGLLGHANPKYVISFSPNFCGGKMSPQKSGVLRFFCFDVSTASQSLDTSKWSGPPS